MALTVTCDGIPARSWMLPGNITDENTVQQVCAEQLRHFFGDTDEVPDCLDAGGT